MRTAGASLALGAAAIHFAMAPSHFDEWPKEGWAFIAAAWMQCGVGVLLLARPSRTVWAAAAALSAGLVAVWAVSRTVGFPFGPHAGHAEAALLVDVICVALELALIGLAAVTLWPNRPEPAPALRRVWVAVPLVTAGLVTAALASPSARDHAREAHGGHPADGSDHAGPQAAHGQAPQFRLDRASRQALERQLATTADAARRWPTFADARRDGYRRSGPYTPGLGVHMLKPQDARRNADGDMDVRDLRDPVGLLYTGTERRAPLVGLMYESSSRTEPEGFVGRNDEWHLHQGVCVVRRRDGGHDVPFGPRARPVACKELGGLVVSRTRWMVHVWSVPGHGAPKGGPFAHFDPRLACSDGTYATVPFDEWLDHPRNVCRSGAARILPG